MRLRGWTAGTALGGVIVAALSLAAPAAAQDDPYGSTTTTAPPRGPTTTCIVQGSGTVEPGTTATVTIRHASRGDRVRLFFDGEQVAEADAIGPGQSAMVNFDMSFTVPEDTQPGSHQVVAVGTSFTATCQTRSGGTEVLSGSQSRANDDRGAARRSSTRPLTGIYVLLALALGLLLLASVFVAPSKRRQRAARTASRPRVTARR